MIYKKKFILCFCLCMAVLVFMFEPLLDYFGIHCNLTASAPKGIYLLDKHTDLKEQIKGHTGRYLLENDKIPGLPETVRLKCRYLIKSMLAFPGDTVDVKNNQIYINGQPANNVLIKKTNINGHEIPQTMKYPCKIPEGYYFVGSNVKDGYDSRYWGLVPQKAIKGRVRLVYAFK